MSIVPSIKRVSGEIRPFALALGFGMLVSWVIPVGHALASPPTFESPKRLIRSLYLQCSKSEVYVEYGPDAAGNGDPIKVLRINARSDDLMRRSLNHMMNKRGVGYLLGICDSSGGFRLTINEIGPSYPDKPSKEECNGVEARLFLIEGKPTLREASKSTECTQKAEP